jgi:hypothetical protein
MKTILFKPFERYSERMLIAVGLIFVVPVVIAGAALDVRFDGVLDLHFAPESSVKAVAIDLAVDFIALFVLLFAAAKWINRKTRAVDILSTVLVAKIPMYLPMFFNAGGKLTVIGEEIMEQAKAGQSPALSAGNIALLVVFIVLVLLFMVWSVALLYNGYKTAANAKGAKAVLLFIGALLLAEIASKVALHVIEISTM